MLSLYVAALVFFALHVGVSGTPPVVKPMLSKRMDPYTPSAISTTPAKAMMIPVRVREFNASLLDSLGLV